MYAFHIFFRARKWKLVTMHDIEHENKIFEDYRAQITEQNKSLLTNLKIDEISKLLKNSKYYSFNKAIQNQFLIIN